MNFSYRRVFPGTLLVASALVTQISQAQTKPPTPKAGVSGKNVPKSAIALDLNREDLAIKPLPQVPIEFEFVGTERDLNGLVQSFLHRATVTPAKTETNKAPSIQDETAKTETAKTEMAATSKDEKSPWKFDLSDDELLQMLKEIHFLRAQSFNFVQKKSEKDTDATKHVDAQEFYAKDFRAQKGRRQFFSSGSDTTVSVWIFDAPRSWALVTQGPSRSIVARVDGFPPLEVLGRLLSQVVKD